MRENKGGRNETRKKFGNKQRSTDRVERVGWRLEGGKGGGRKSERLSAANSEMTGSRGRFARRCEEQECGGGGPPTPEVIIYGRQRLKAD